MKTALCGALVVAKVIELILKEPVRSFDELPQTFKLCSDIDPPRRAVIVLLLTYPKAHKYRLCQFQCHAISSQTIEYQANWL